MLEILSALTGIGIDEVGLNDVGEFQNQPVDIFVEFCCTTLLGDAPGVTEQAESQVFRAVDDFAVGFQVDASARQAVGNQFVLPDQR